MISYEHIQKTSSDNDEMLGRIRNIAQLFEGPRGKDLQDALFMELDKSIRGLKKAIASNEEPKKDFRYWQGRVDTITELLGEPERAQAAIAKFESR